MPLLTTAVDAGDTLQVIFRMVYIAG